MATNISTITIDATKSKVWDTLTKPELVKLWQYGSELITSWEVGSDIKFRTEWEGKIFEQWGKILEVRPMELLKYSLFAPRPDLEDSPENYFMMSYILTTEDEQTKLEIIQEDTRPNAVQEAPQGEENPVLQSLKKIAEGNN
ncbi:MAG: SRPBCC domain-containing protein [Ferruginibacter sp.]